MKRKIISINEEKCNGCGSCIPNCQEGALKIIDGKARLISDLFCDGMGACLGHCPEDAIDIIEREAEPYSESKVIEGLIPKGRKTILAHLEHLRDHQETGYLNEAIQYLKENEIEMGSGVDQNKNVSETKPHHQFADLNEDNKHHGFRCPGSLTHDFSNATEGVKERSTANGSLLNVPSELRQWPVQLHLLNPQASYLKNADMVLAADCAAFAMGNFHSRYLQGKSLAIACPKLDTNKESYIMKLTSMIADAKINSLIVVMMEVPCCGGLLQMALTARSNARRNIPIKQSIVSIRGEVLEEEWA
ncbi:MAG: 4Fe-4S dicluster domain-containing protein [Bacteroidota bacterium]